MSRTTQTRRSSRRSQNRTSRAWLSVWPLVLGVLVTPFAVRAASVLAMTGPTALRLLYPYVVLVQNEAQHLTGEQAETLSQIVLWGQFPLYGLLWFLLSRFVLRAAGPLTVLLLHIVGAALAIWTAV